MASDGLWDCLTSDKTGSLVRLWLQTNLSAVYTDAPMWDFQLSPQSHNPNPRTTKPNPNKTKPMTATSCLVKKLRTITR
ncbi:hypothetical protein BDP27DRAFT_1331280 [Rhodocollybia butyracea]|uniref:Uncharacterized protein n=1 Tax=Rhodocollybia butyracea TaxID=206335 RepID=A0A9P5PMJ5_9AGAR|nr:hypothetical protein BDP27DRAFT_1331280 [Rhodocollybia butyracea]